MTYERGRTFVRVGAFIVDWTARQREESPLIDGSVVVLVHEDNGVVTEEAFGGFIISRAGASYGVAFGWLDKRMLLPQRWHPRRLRSYIRWALAGRPPPVPATTEGFFSAATPGAPPDHTAARLAAVSELKRIATEHSGRP